MKTTDQCRHNSFIGKLLAVICLFAVLGLAGCKQQGSAQKDSGKVDRVTENTGPTIEGSADRTAGKMQGVEPSAPQITGTADQYFDDSAITGKVKAAILNDRLLNASRIEVTTEKGNVKLSGSVDSEQAVVRARELATVQQGVKSVQTDLSVAAVPGK